MKKFIQKTIIFLVIGALFIGSLFLSTLTIIKKKSNFTLKAPVKNVIFGHSHPTYAFNDSLINDFKNLAQSAQSNFYSFIKVRNVLLNNSSIETVFIEFTNNQISEIMDSWTWSDANISDRLPHYLPLMNKDEIQLLYEKNSKAFLSSSSKSFRINLINILSNNFDYTSSKIGGYKSLTRSTVDSILSDELKNNTPNINESYNELSLSYNKLSLINLEYLEKTIDFCTDNKIKVYLIRSPQHKKYQGLRNEKEFIKIRNERFKSIEFLDFNNFPISNSHFGDLDHLNAKGAKIFSNWFNELMQKGLLTEENKQMFINHEIEKYKLQNID